MGVKEGDKVRVEYTGRLETGEIFDSSQHGEHSHPIEFIVGKHEVIKGFEDGVLGMEVDDEREFSVKPEDAYGVHREELVKEFSKSQIPLEKKPEVGMVLGLMASDGRQFHATITKVTDDKITLDLNHPLAGKVLIFRIRLVSIKGKKDQESEKEEVKAQEEKVLRKDNNPEKKDRI